MNAVVNQKQWKSIKTLEENKDFFLPDS